MYTILPVPFLSSCKHKARYFSPVQRWVLQGKAHTCVQTNRRWRVSLDLAFCKAWVALVPQQCQLLCALSAHIPTHRSNRPVLICAFLSSIKTLQYRCQSSENRYCIIHSAITQVLSTTKRRIHSPAFFEDVCVFFFPLTILCFLSLGNLQVNLQMIFYQQLHQT